MGICELHGKVCEGCASSRWFDGSVLHGMQYHSSQHLTPRDAVTAVFGMLVSPHGPSATKTYVMDDPQYAIALVSCPP